MEKVKSFFKKALDTIKGSIKSFPLTIITIVLTSLYLCGQVMWYFSNEEDVLKLVFSAAIFAVGTYFAEVIAKDLKKEKIPLYILSFLSAIGFYIVISNVEDAALYNVAKLSFCYIASLVIASVYMQFKDSNISFEAYYREVGISSIKVSLVYSIMSIGVTLLGFIIYELFDFIDMEKFFAVTQILVAGFFYMPRMLYIFRVKEEEKESNGFFEALYKYPAGLLICAAFVIIYLYMFKIIVSQEIPSNVIFRITAALFIVAAPSWTIINSYKFKNLYEKVFKILPLLFIPFILLQVYSLGVRISDYGLTPVRYLGVVFVIFEMLYILAFQYKREKIHLVMPTVAVALWIILLAPVVNLDRLSQLAQIGRVKEYFKIENIENTSYDKKMRIYNAYHYLKYLDDGDEILDSFLTADERRAIENLKDTTPVPYIRNDEEDGYPVSETFTLRNYQDSVDVQGYSKVYKLDYSTGYYYGRESDNEHFTFVKEIGDDKELDYKPIIDKLIDDNDKGIEIYEFDLDEHNHIVITYANIECVNKDFINQVTIEGWLLVK